MDFQQISPQEIKKWRFLEGPSSGNRKRRKDSGTNETKNKRTRETVVCVKSDERVKKRTSQGVGM